MRHLDRHFAVARAIALAIALASMAGCSAFEPYVDNPGEFNRESQDFGREPETIDAVDICYARQATTAQTVRDMASERCAKYGKRAVFLGQDILECPILTPLRARYSCVQP